MAGILDLTTGIVFLKGWSGTINGVNLALTGTLSVNGSTGTTGTVLIGGSPASWSATPSITSWTTSAADTVNVAGIAATPTAGLNLNNATLSTAAVPVQMPPGLFLNGNVWNTTATAANNTDSWSITSVPVSGATPSSLLKFGSSLNGAAATYLFQGTSNGAWQVGDGVVSEVALGFTADPDTGIIRGGSGLLVFVTNGARRTSLDSDWHLGSGSQLGWSSNADPLSAAIDTYLTRSAAGVVAANGGWALGTTLFASATAPTIASGFGTTPSVVASNGTAAFQVNVGTIDAAQTGGVITMPAATTGWVANVKNLTAVAANRADQHTVQTASTTTSITIQNQTISTGAALAWTTADKLWISAMAY